MEFFQSAKPSCFFALKPLQCCRPHRQMAEAEEGDSGNKTVSETWSRRENKKEAKSRHNTSSDDKCEAVQPCSRLTEKRPLLTFTHRSLLHLLLLSVIFPGPAHWLQRCCCLLVRQINICLHDRLLELLWNGRVATGRGSASLLEEERGG